jgi:hypothetical protein
MLKFIIHNQSHIITARLIRLREVKLKFSSKDRGSLTSVFGILMIIFVGIVIEDLRYDPYSCALHLKEKLVWLLALGTSIFIGGLVWSSDD